MWLVFVVIDMFISGLLDIIEKKGSKNQPLHFWAQANILYGFLSIIVGIIMLPSILNLFDFKILLLTFPITFLSTLGYYCSVMAFKYSSISQVSPILRSKIILVLILSCIFINDKLSLLQIFFIFVIFILNVLLNYEKESKSSKKGIYFAIGFLFANGTATFINKIVLDFVQSPITLTFYGGITSILSVLIIILILGKLDLLNVKKFKNKKYIVCMESLEVIAVILSRYAILHGNVVIVTAMTSSSIIITMILSKLIFKEKINTKKSIIIMLIVISLVILSILSI